MNDHVYRVIEVVGSSAESSDDAIRQAITRAAETIENIGWFEVIGTRGHVEDGTLKHFQVTLKLGFTIADPKGGHL